jgi:hypothetical protein
MKNRNKRRLVKCDSHGEMEGYVACIHVVRHMAPVAYVEHPGQSHPTLGSILCSECLAADRTGFRKDLPQELLTLVCGFCARDRKINQVTTIQ